MDNISKLKEAIKVGLAFALVYGIALKVNWLSPSWAGWSVVAVAALPAGQSIKKGLARILGTFLACMSGLVIISVSVQDRWIFAFLTSGLLFLISYIMLSDKPRFYFWFVTGYVCLVITAAAQSPGFSFHVAVYRSLDTILGIVVYTLVAVFIWPLNNAGAIKKAAGELLNTQNSLLKQAKNLLMGNQVASEIKRTNQLQASQLAQLSKSLKAEGAENYQVQEIKTLWDRFESLSYALMKTTDRLFTELQNPLKYETVRLLPLMDEYFDRLEITLHETNRLISGDPPAERIEPFQLMFDKDAAKKLSHLEMAALVVITHELNEIGKLTGLMHETAMEMTGYKEQGKEKIVIPGIAKRIKQGIGLPVPDLENLRGALYIAMVIFTGFVIWFYFDPPGHMNWYLMAGVLAMVFAMVQQIRINKVIVPFAVAMLLIGSLYIFVLPHLTSFAELGLILFVVMFAIRYFLTGGAIAVFSIVFLQVFVITNPQKFSFSDLANGFVFLIMVLFYLHGMSYIMNSSRPEKLLLRMMNRFFKSADYLVSKQKRRTGWLAAFADRYRQAYYSYELHTLPGKITRWGKSIDHKLYPENDFGKIEDLVAKMQVLVLRIEALPYPEPEGDDGKNLLRVNEGFLKWNTLLHKTFSGWDGFQKGKLTSAMIDELRQRFSELESRLDEVYHRNQNIMGEQEAEIFYLQTGRYRGLTEAVLDFSESAGKIDWGHWKEERFQ